MRTVWSALVVLVLLAPFGGVGITPTPGDAEIIAAPRAPAFALAKRIESERPLGLLAVAVPAMHRALRHELIGSVPPPIATERHPPAGPRDPPA